MKVVINRCYGGFGLSDMAVDLYKKRTGITDPDWWINEISRDDTVLVDIVEELGDTVDTRFSKLTIVEVPDDVRWTIEEYDGMEWVAEVHRTWT